ncbi:MAG: outer membrane lipoprotein-sorting protein [Candidatus Margulisbacteria bacterium]|nr:outer membrane lipoprotein-sorting protein [Candidatus Margulisiibacteriota bacterium]
MMRGTTSQGEYEMIVKTKRWKRTMRMNYWSQGTEKSFVLVTYPARDKGTTFLKLKNEMWQYVPKIERTIKIPPSMMMQSWMGSDFTNDDLVKESSIVEDYDGKILSQDNTSWKIELIPKEEAAVAWGKVIVWIDKKTYLPTKEDFYDEEGVLVRIMRFEDVKKSGNRYYPEKMYLEPQTEDKEGNSTTFIVKSIVFDEPIKEGLFSLKSLKSMSK